MLNQLHFCPVQKRVEAEISHGKFLITFSPSKSFDTNENLVADSKLSLLSRMTKLWRSLDDEQKTGAQPRRIGYTNGLN